MNQIYFIGLLVLVFKGTILLFLLDSTTNLIKRVLAIVHLSLVNSLMLGNNGHLSQTLINACQ